MRGNRIPEYSTSDGQGLFFSSPSDLSPGSQWMPPAIQAINIDEYGAIAKRNNTNDHILRQAPFAPDMEGTSANPYGGESTSSCSDSSESEYAGKPCLSSHHNSTSRNFSVSKSIHPLARPTQYPREASSGINITEFSEPCKHEIFSQSCKSPVGFKCGLCGRFLSQRSPWSTRRLVRSFDLPVASVLSCQHVFHAECLDRTSTTTMTQKNDPSCPLCHGLEKNSPERPRLKPVGEDGPSRPWGCGQAGGCLEGALHVPPRNAMLILNRNRMKRNLSLRGNATKEFPGKLRKSCSFYSERLNGTSSDQGAVGSSNSAASMKNM